MARRMILKCRKETSADALVPDVDNQPLLSSLERLLESPRITLDLDDSGTHD
ncbi:hypothetical protein [Acaryochloris marina]|uniref:hypothetical protein n=1 Tax=Acaryochloris marina TaxID=155978 RepID=UPI0021C3C1CE|nr:hypothetical protein [Acaryochloris marina]BDM80032.1 hypothetical protein AM10699_29000 [Acaryochloris marina MBIC10699]